METTTVEEAVAEIMKISRSLPPRPEIEEVEAATTLIRSVEKDDQVRFDAIAKQPRGAKVSEELFFVLQEMQRNSVQFRSKEQKREATKLLDLENVHHVFDELIQRASQCVSSSSPSSLQSKVTSVSSTVTSSSTIGTNANDGSAGLKSDCLNSTSVYSVKEPRRSSKPLSKDDSFLQKANATFYADGLKPLLSSGQVGDKLSLIKLASMIEVSFKKSSKELILQNKLMDQIDRLPDSVGKLSRLVTLDLSENRIIALPATIRGLSALTRLDLHSNRIAELPDAIGNLLSLVFLDIRANQISSLPQAIGKLVCLEELDLSSNKLSFLPDTIGSLVSLKKLNVETNDIEEIPHTICHCSSLQELLADYNRLKALPEAVGKIPSLEILSVRYNNIRQLPTTMSCLSKLRELDVSFNELEQVPESLGFATSLLKLNIGNNFADLRSLPRSIGNLEMLEELDMSNNQIRVLPESFRLLTKLRVLRLQENPLEVPPRQVAEKGPQAVVQYMADLIANKVMNTQPTKQKKSWVQRCFFLGSNEREHATIDYIKG